MKEIFAESRILILTVLIGLILWSGNSFAAPKVPVCPARPRIFAELHRKTPDLAPVGQLLVGREVNLWIEALDPQGLKLWVRHNFKTGRKEFVCATLPAQVQENFSIPVLVLNDRSPAKATGDAVWQMQVMLRDREMGLWHQKSGLVKSDQLLGADAKSLWFNVFTGEKLFFNERISGAYKIQSLVEFDPSL